MRKQTTRYNFSLDIVQFFMQDCFLECIDVETFFFLFLNSLQQWDQSRTWIESHTDSKAIQSLFAITGIQLISAALFRSKTCSGPTLIRWFRDRILKSFQTFKALHSRILGILIEWSSLKLFLRLLFTKKFFVCMKKLNLNTLQALTGSSRHVY